MFVKDRVEVASTDSRDEKLGIKVGCIGTIKRSAHDLVWVEFDDPSVYEKINEIKSAIDGITTINHVLFSSRYDDNIKAFCLHKSQVKLVGPALKTGDIVKVHNISSADNREYGINNGDVGMIGVVGDESLSRVEVRIRGDRPYDEEPYSLLLMKNQVSFTGLNVSDL